VLLKLVYGRIGVLVQSVQSGVSDGAVSRLDPTCSKTGSSRNPIGTNSIHPSIPPPKETFSSTIREKMIRLCRFMRGVRPSADPSATPAATCPGVPAECSVLIMDWISLRSPNMGGT
jgi:hypothetical protein